MQNFRPFLDTFFTIPAFLCAAGPQDTAYGTKPAGQVCGTLQKDCAVADGRRFRGPRGMIRDGFGWFGAVLGACGTAGGSVEGQPAFFRGRACPPPGVCLPFCRVLPLPRRRKFPVPAAGFSCPQYRGLSPHGDTNGGSSPRSLFSRAGPWPGLSRTSGPVATAFRPICGGGGVYSSHHSGRGGFRPAGT